MRALLLAAGSGTRLAPYTKDLPKGMLPIQGVSLLERQIRLFRSLGVSEIGVVTGYHAEAIQFEGIHRFHNPDYATTNMVHSLVCARSFLTEDTIISYSDLLPSKKLLAMVLASSCNIGVTVDADWRAYWTERFGHAEDDLESLQVQDNRIVSLGAKVTSSQGLEYRYVGINRYSAQGLQTLLAHFDQRSKNPSPWSPSGKPFALGYMTDMLNELAQAGHLVQTLVTHGGWMEFDTAQDYEAALHVGPLHTRLLSILDSHP